MRSKLPWEYVKSSIDDPFDKILDADGGIVICEGHGMDDSFFSDADAALVVEAVNALHARTVISETNAKSAGTDASEKTL